MTSDVRSGARAPDDIVERRRPPTVFEAIAHRLRVPTVAVVAGQAVLFGVPFLPIAVPDRAARMFTNVSVPGFGRFDNPGDLVWLAVWLAVLTFVPAGSSFMLDRISETPSKAPCLGAGIEPEIRATLTSARRVGPAFLMSAGFTAILLVPYLSGGHLLDTFDAALAVADTVIVVGRFFVVFTLVWIYVRGLAGLWRISSRPLTLAPSHLDPWLGTRQLGSLGLSMASTYFLFLGLSFLLVPTGFRDAVVQIGLLAVLVGLGVVMFFLPLQAVHRQMAAEKARGGLVARSARDDGGGLPASGGAGSCRCRGGPAGHGGHRDRPAARRLDQDVAVRWLDPHPTRVFGCLAARADPDRAAAHRVGARPLAGGVAARGVRSDPASTRRLAGPIDPANQLLRKAAVPTITPP